MFIPFLDIEFNSEERRKKSKYFCSGLLLLSQIFIRWQENASKQNEWEQKKNCRSSDLFYGVCSWQWYKAEWFRLQHSRMERFASCYTFYRWDQYRGYEWKCRFIVKGPLLMIMPPDFIYLFTPFIPNKCAHTRIAISQKLKATNSMIKCWFAFIVRWIILLWILSHSVPEECNYPWTFRSIISHLKWVCGWTCRSMHYCWPWSKNCRFESIWNHFDVSKPFGFSAYFVIFK